MWTGVLAVLREELLGISMGKLSISAGRSFWEILWVDPLSVQTWNEHQQWGVWYGPSLNDSRIYMVFCYAMNGPTNACDSVGLFLVNYESPWGCYDWCMCR